MIQYHTDPTSVVTEVFGLHGDTASRKTALFRSLLKNGDGGILNSVQLTYSCVLPAAAYLALVGTFSGRACGMFNPDEDALEREGFYARGSHLFHADSVDFEHTATTIENDGRASAAEAIAAGVNTFQASEMMSLGAAYHAVFTGTFRDWAELVGTHGNVANFSHPAAREFVLNVWADLKTRMPLLTEAYNERVA
jgi:hypothetical protein